MTSPSFHRPALQVLPGRSSLPQEWRWFCGHCAAPPPGDEPPAPGARVCPSCGLGLLLETRADHLPSERDTFVVVDAALLIQGISRRAEQVLGISEDLAVNQPVANLLVAAESEPRSPSVAASIVDALGDDDSAPFHAFVRPWNTFGVRMRARISPCGPPRAALLVLEATPPSLHVVPSR